jgi:putative tributyrin esterase
MAVCEIHFNAQHALQRMTSCMVVLPENAGPGPFPVFYLLHGLSDNHTAWTRRTSLERYVDGLPFIVVMPDGGRGFYTDSHTDPLAAFETFIVRDLIGFIDRTFQTRATREGRVIAGLSMGGFGAVKLAFKYPELFAAAASHSGVLRSGAEWNPANPNTELARIFGPTLEGGPNDVYALARRADRDRLPALRIDCGRDDFLFDSNRRFHAHLDSLEIPHEYAEHPGAHDWAYWDAHIQETIAFFAGALGLKR